MLPNAASFQQEDADGVYPLLSNGVRVGVVSDFTYNPTKNRVVFLINDF